MRSGEQKRQNICNIAAFVLLLLLLAARSPQHNLSGNFSYTI